MKLWILVTLFIGAFCAWDQEDYELFDLNDSLQQQFPGSTFYSILEVEPTADDREITKQYRKKSLSLHPDKNPSEEAGKLYALLTSISKILKDEEFRKRYDGHLKKGFPSWKGTGYYYTRYKPGFLTAVLAILVFVSVGQYITLWIFYNRDLQAYEEEKKKLENTSVQQLKKQLKKQGSPQLTKKQLKQASAGESHLGSSPDSKNQNKSKFFMEHPRSNYPKPHPQETRLQQRAQHIQFGVHDRQSGRTRVPSMRSMSERSKTPVHPALVEQPVDRQSEKHSERPVSHLDRTLHQPERQVNQPERPIHQTERQVDQYEFKPPAAAKYFLWDSTRTGKTVILEPKQRLSSLTISVPSFKALSIHLYKINLLEQAESPLSLESGFAGFLLGREHVDENIIFLDRFDQGKEGKPQGLVEGDIYVPIMNEAQEEVSLESYLMLSHLFLDHLQSLPSEKWLWLPSILGARFEEDMKLQYRCLVPSYHLEIFKIHPLRFVSTSLTIELMSEDDGQPGFGLMCIDQARQLYLLRTGDPGVSKLPLIGIWTKHMDLENPKIYSLLTHFITNRTIQRLDTGKSTLLICQFNNEKRPQCYECLYTPKEVSGLNLIGSMPIYSFNTAVELEILEMDLHCSLALQQVLGITVSPTIHSQSDPAQVDAEEPLAEEVHQISAQETVEQQSAEETVEHAPCVQENVQKEPSVVETLADNADLQTHEPPVTQEEKPVAQPENLPVANSADVPAVKADDQSATVDTVEKQPQMNVNNVQETFFVKQTAVETQQLLYISLLQQQIQMLQQNRKSVVSVGTQTNLEMREAETQYIPDSRDSESQTLTETEPKDTQTQDLTLPTDTGTNYQPFFAIEEDPKHIIASLVSDPEKSFLFTDPEVSVVQKQDDFSLASLDYLKKKLPPSQDKLWIDKYKPFCVAELLVHKKKIEQVREWLSKELVPRILLITGPSGSGKQCTLELLCKEMNRTLVVYESPSKFESIQQHFMDFIRSTRKQQDKRVYLMRELPEIPNLQIILQSYLDTKGWVYPLVLMLSDPSDMFKLKLQMDTIHFNPLTKRFMIQLLNRINQIEFKGNLKQTQLEDIADQAHGDMRQAIQMLQLGTIGGKFKARKCGGRDSIASAIETAEMVLKPTERMPETDTDHSFFNSFVLASYAQHLESFQDSFKLADTMSIADLIGNSLNTMQQQLARNLSVGVPFHLQQGKSIERKTIFRAPLQKIGQMQRIKRSHGNKSDWMVYYPLKQKIQETEQWMQFLPLDLETIPTKRQKTEKSLGKEYLLDLIED